MWRTKGGGDLEPVLASGAVALLDAQWIISHAEAVRGRYVLRQTKRWVLTAQAKKAVKAKNRKRTGRGGQFFFTPKCKPGYKMVDDGGVLARSKISGSLLHRLSRPWHGLGLRGSHRDRYGAPPKFSSPAAGAY